MQTSRMLTLKEARERLDKVQASIEAKRSEINVLEQQRDNLEMIHHVLYSQSKCYNGKTWKVSEIGNWKYIEKPKLCPHCKKYMENGNARYLKNCDECSYPNPNYGNANLSKTVCSVCGSIDPWTRYTEGLCPSVTYGDCVNCGNHVVLGAG